MQIKQLVNYIKRHKLIVFVITMTFVIITLLLSTEIYDLLSINYEVGQVSADKIKAPRTFINQAETDRLKEAASNSVQSYYKIDTEITEEVIRDVDVFFKTLEDERNNYSDYIKETTISNDVNFSQDGFDENSEPQDSENIEDVIEVLPNQIVDYEVKNKDLLQVITENELIYLAKLTNDEFESYKTFTNNIIIDLLDQGVKSESILNALLLVEDYIGKQDLNIIVTDVTYKIVVAFLKPNLVVDQTATEKAKNEAIESIEPIYYLEGQTIVDEGEIITEDIYQALNDIGYIEKNITELIISYAGVITLNLIVTLFVLIYIYFFKREYIHKKGIIGVSCMLYLTFVLTTILLNETWIKFMPLYTVIYLFSVFIEKKVVGVILINLIFLLSNFIPLTSNEMLFLLLTANMEILFVKIINEKNKIVFGSALVSLFFGIIYVLIYITEGYNFHELINEIYKIPLTTFIAIIFSYGVSPAIASMFGILTNNRLLEFTRPDHPLLRRLTMEASGTYQHSLVVANLSEEAALAIGANSTLCRVASYFHDVGKLQDPLFFGENQNGYNPHDEMSPINSAKIILNHTLYGQELGKKYKLPNEVIDIIPQHHGSTKVGYFYSKAMNDENIKDKITDEMFTYSGIIPQSKEAGIIMLADTAEAAVRSVIYKMDNFEEVEEFVTKLIKGKLDAGQLLDSGLTFKDIEKIKKSFMMIFKGMYHNRVEYPAKSGGKSDE